MSYGRGGGSLPVPGLAERTALSQDASYPDMCKANDPG